jgi:peptidoglycan/LPS O-acetylase OafA/YrhL
MELNLFKPTYFKQLDGLRFLAVLAIMAVHWLKISSIMIYSNIASNISVDLYFVLSGFLITRILLQQKIKKDENTTTGAQALKIFYIRRSLRIFPIYYLLIFICIALNVTPEREIYPWLMSYTTNFLRFKTASLGPFGHLWTLAIEEQFYLLFPFFILWIPRQWLKRFLIAGIFLAIISRYFSLFVFHNTLGVFLFPFCCADALCIGGLLAYSLVYEKTIKPILNKKYFLILSVVAFVVCSYRFINIQVNDYLSLLLLRLSISGMCIWIIGTGINNEYKGIMKLILENSFVIYLGKICYGIYLFHFLAPYIAKYTYSFIHIQNPWPRFLVIENAIVYFILTILMASLSWHFIEQPINNIKKKFV